MAEPATWDNAFLAVFLVAANTFLQRPGAVLSHQFCNHDVAENTCLELPGRVLRTSPLVCLVDSVDIVARLTWGILTGSGLGQTSRRILKQRGFHGSSAVLNDEFEIAWPLRLISFALAASQLAKLSGMQGVPLTLLASGCYFVSWLSIELLHLTSSSTDAIKTSASEKAAQIPQVHTKDSIEFISIKKALVPLAAYVSLLALIWVHGAVVITEEVAEGLVVHAGLPFYALLGSMLLISLLGLVSIPGSIPGIISLWVLYLSHLAFSPHSSGSNFSVAELQASQFGWRWLLFVLIPVLVMLFWSALVLFVASIPPQEVGGLFGLSVTTGRVIWGWWQIYVAAIFALFYARQIDFAGVSKPEWAALLG